MFRKALVALWSTCAFLTANAAGAAPGDIVLYATDGSNLHGNWIRQPDSTAAGGQVLASVDRGWANTAGALASPADFIDFRFNAPSGTPYRLWVRMRAAGNSRNNDSVYVQFSDVMSLGGSPAWGIGTTDSVVVNLAGDSAGTGMSGWGWRDGAYWVTPTPPLSFSAGGTHTLRVQTREDGVAIDQVVLSPATYLSAAPGAAAGDATIVPRPSTLAAGWNSQLVGAGFAGDASSSNGSLTLTNAGADIWGTADAFQYVSRAAGGDARIVARVASLQSTQPYAKAGVMFRDSTAAGSAHVLLDMRPNGAIEFMTRSATGGATVYVAGGVQPAPAWLRLTRLGNTFTGEVSPDGVAWTAVGATSAPLAVNGLVGVALTSHDVTRIATGSFDAVAVTVIPSAPGLPSPAPSAIGVAPVSSLSWSAAGATSYDLRFGVTANPPLAAAGLSTSAYTLPPLQNGVTYYWQVVARNFIGVTAGPVWSFTTAFAAVPWTERIVLYSADASNLHGNWTRVANPTAAGGQALASADSGWASTGAPLAAPTDYFDVTFTAPAATPYHVWLRMRAGGNSKYNDSVYVQLSDALGQNGSPAFALGTTSALCVNLASDSTGASLNGWGWQDGAYWLAQSSIMTFATSGSHTLRIQTREDGAFIDQVILSPADDVPSTPGLLSGDWTIVPKGRQETGAPGSYNAITDRNAYAKPPLPLLGPAGFEFMDPTFGSALLRVTDGGTRPGMVNRSFRVPSNAHLSAWNATSTMFYVISNDGTSIPYTFNPITMAAARIQPAATGNGGQTLAFYGEPQFSLVRPSVIYGAASGGNNRTISQYDFQTGLYTPIVNLDTLVPGLTGYVGGVMSGGVPAEALLTFFGGGAQDSHYYALWAPVGDMGARKLLNTMASTINGVPTQTVLNFRLHSAQIDRGGRFVLLYSTAVDLGSPRYASKVYVWDTATDAVTPVTSGGNDGGTAMRPSGHDATGYGWWINQDCCTNSTWDAGQWQIRRLTSLSQTSDLIAPVQAVKEVYLADHTSWNNAQPSTLVPVISSTYRFGNNTAPWRAWDDEIIGIDTASLGGGNVWRFAHHRSLVASDSNPTAPYFWYQPIANVSPDGKWAVFTSNWEKSLGTDSAEGTFRQDVFLVQLTPRP